MNSDERWIFVSHVDWRWIKQRPHWLAEEAGSAVRVLVLFRLHRRRLGLPKNRSRVKRLALLPLPLGAALEGRALWAAACIALQKLWVWIVVATFKPTHLYVGHPKLWAIIPRRMPHQVKVVYDCMDDALAMAPPQQVAELAELESALCERAVRVVVSSRALYGRLERRYGEAVRGKLVLVQNGVSKERRYKVGAERADGVAVGEVVIGYAGTIAAWFDFDSLIYAIERNPRVQALLVGPRGGNEPIHDMIVYQPPVEHDALPQFLSGCKALIMPFVPSALVTAVNPVKLYEYLMYDVPVIVRRYEEIDVDFGQFVYGYDDREQLSALLRRLVVGELPRLGDPAEIAAFLEQSSWGARWTSFQGSLKGA